MEHYTTTQNGQFQSRARIRVPSEMLPPTYQFHVIQAIRRNPEVDKDGIYTKALQDITSGRNREAFDRISKRIERLLAYPKAKRNRNMVLADSRWINLDDDACRNINEFNRRFLNDSGAGALLTALKLEAIQLDPAAIDAFRGGDAVTAAYGERTTQGHKILGKKLQQRLKQFSALDEPATAEAADCYVEYRFLHDGKFPDYKSRKELEGTARSEKYLRDWFGRFDKALGHRPAPRGRPRNRRGMG